MPVWISYGRDAHLLKILWWNASPLSEFKEKNNGLILCISGLSLANRHASPSLYPPCQMYRYDAYWLPTGPINASWDCRLAGCWLCSHGNWLEPCVWPHEGHKQKLGYRTRERREREGSCPRAVSERQKNTFWLIQFLNPVPCVCRSLRAQSLGTLHA